MANNFRKRSLILAMGLALSSTPLYAAEEEQDDDGEEEAQTMVIVGSRAAPRSIGDSPVPVDVISADEMAKNGSTDMTSLLAAVAPSFNVNEQPISDAGTITRPANLRGLPPDNTLVLVNGKRRHRSAVITFLGGGIADGSQGPDVSVIPAMALKQVEILRDGASAQYGSDAIAGVLNFVLKDNSSGGEFEARWGEYAEGDGDTAVFSGNLGLPLSERGFANFTFELKDAEATSRSVQRGDAATLIAAGNTNVADPAQIWGSPEVKDDIKFFGNFGLDLGNNKEAYMFGNYAERTVDGGFFFRNPNTRPGVFAGIYRDVNGTIMLRPDPEVDAAGAAAWDNATPTLLVGSLAGADQQINCPLVEIVNNVPDPAALASLPGANCFAFNSMFPGGFTPRFGGQVVDTSIVLGTKGEFESGMLYDLSFSVGRNAVDFTIRNTVNASLGPNTPTSFEPGSYIQLEKALNYDISKEIETDVVELLTFSAGVEWREDSFEIKPGDLKSFEVGILGFDPAANNGNGATQGFGIGSNGFPGFKPEAAGVFSRSNVGVYIDLETYVNDALMIDFAVRYEDFSDFGNTTDWKLSGHFQASDEFAFRGSVSTGFRAPTVGQSNVINVSTQFTNGALADQATLPPTNPISVQKGGKALTPEESESFTIGAVWEHEDLFVTIDLFQIEVTDRIAQTSTLLLTQDDITALLAQGINDATSFTGIRYFTNDFDTTTQGIDIVISYSWDGFGGDNDLNFAINHTSTEVDSRNPDIIDDTRVRQLEENVPEDRATITYNHSQDNWDLLARLNYYGEYFEPHLDDPTLPIDAGSAVTVDAEFGFNANESLRLAIGAKNLFDEEPDLNPWATVVGSQFPPTSPMGFNGRFLYLKANYSF
ncbi:TonB-dependent receptor plug domain-containing protein [Aliikangiella coralliicola]|uniref:TonB-dependent receptor n=1 Tax=Aliikangiella coralliicola TaxID=2592383 RepID=A0A545UEF5_9GAMM|nr:TonB-dependent receptor [Aliikangiella coralliicola]TQV87838.1 TonB-dependent receptor [Aliikangiella coralliicola]